MSPGGLERHCGGETLFDTISDTSGDPVLFHVSEEPGIVEFNPRPSKFTQEPVVWAVNNEKMPSLAG